MLHISPSGKEIIEPHFKCYNTIIELVHNKRAEIESTLVSMHRLD